MAVLGSIFGALGRLLNRLVNAALGWAGLLLFGRLSGIKQTVLLAITVGSILWVATLIGVLLPDAGAVLIAAVPVPDGVAETWVRLVMLIAAIVLPLLIGVALLWLAPTDRRPKALAMLPAVLRGYPFAFAMGCTVVFLAVVATVRKAFALVRRWEEAHVVVVVKPGKYEELVHDVEQALDDADFEVDRKPAPAVLATPAKVLGVVAGTSLSGLVPDRLWRLVHPGLDVLIHPSDILVSGTKEQVARARAAIAIRLTWAPAYLTTSAEGQKLEDAITSAAGLGPSEAAPRLREIDRELARIVVPYEEWETLYRMRLQLQSERVGVAPDVAGQGEPAAEAVVQGATPAAPAARRGAAAVTTRPSPVVWAAAAGIAALSALDVILALLPRRKKIDREKALPIVRR